MVREDFVKLGDSKTYYRDQKQKALGRCQQESWHSTN